MKSARILLVVVSAATLTFAQEEPRRRGGLLLGFFDFGAVASESFLTGATLGMYKMEPECISGLNLSLG